MNTIPIVFCFDANLVMPAGVCITSLLKNARTDTFYDIYIIHSPIEEKAIEKLNELTKIFPNSKITFILAQDTFSSAYQIRGISTLTYYRLLIPELIPQYDKILYSDVDVIFRDDLSEYYNTDLGDCYFGAVDVVLPLRPDVRQYMENILHLDTSHGYYLAGNLVINSRMLRKNNIVKKFIELAQNNYRFQDMDIINLACHGNFKALPLSYCLTTNFYTMIFSQGEQLSQLVSRIDIDKAIASGIVHYNGAKPWITTCYGQDIWWAYYRESHFYDEKFCYEYYTRLRAETDQWSLRKRIKHLLKFFMR